MRHPVWYDRLSDFTYQRQGMRLLLLIGVSAFFSIGVVIGLVVASGWFAVSVLGVAGFAFVVLVGFHGISRNYAYISLDEVADCHDRDLIVSRTANGWWRK